MDHAKVWPGGATPRTKSRAAAQRSYPTPEVGAAPRRTNPVPRPGTAVWRNNPMSKEWWLHRHRRA